MPTSKTTAKPVANDEDQSSALEAMQGQIGTLEAMVQELTAAVQSTQAAMDQQPSLPNAERRPVEERGDYVPHGSAQHARILGLVEDPDSELGWKLADRTAFGAAATEPFLQAVLEEKVRELTTPMPTPQSVDPRQPGYAPPLWMPDTQPA